MRLTAYREDVIYVAPTDGIVTMTDPATNRVIVLDAQLPHKHAWDRETDVAHVLRQDRRLRPLFAVLTNPEKEHETATYPDDFSFLPKEEAEKAGLEWAAARYYAAQRQETERKEAERIASEKAEQERLAKEREEADRKALEAAEQARKEADRSAREKAETALTQPPAKTAEAGPNAVEVPLEKTAPTKKGAKHSR